MSPRSNTIATYEWLIAHGYSPLEIPFRDKTPIVEAWQSETYEARRSYFETGKTNISARLGRGGLRDIDLDADDAIWFARKLLPRTPAMFGRESAPYAHFLYECTNADRKFKVTDPIRAAKNRELGKDHPDITKADIVDIRGLGQHTVLPGSVHKETGEFIDWMEGAHYPAPTRVEIDDLERAAKVVGLCTLISRYIWLDGMRNDVCLMLSGVLYFLDFELDEAEAIFRLLMEHDNDDDKSRLATLRTAYKRAEEGKKTRGATALKKFLPEVGPVLDKFYEWFGKHDSSVIDEYNERFALVPIGSDIRVASFQTPTGTVDFLKKSAFHDLFAPDTIQIPDDNGRVMRVPKTKIWWNSPRRAQYNGVTFDPSSPPDEPAPNNMLNLWRGWGAEPRPGSWQDAQPHCKMWLDHLRTVIANGDEELYNWCLSWFADIFRNPGRKPGTALALLGSQGAGKTSVFDYFRPVLRSAYVRIAQPNQLTGNFNSHMQNCLFLHAEEAIFAKSPAATSILKDMITSDTIALERKGQDLIVLPSYMRVGFTSNADHMIGVNHDDRRYTFINLKRRAKDETKKKDYDQERFGEGPSALMRYLLDCPDIDENLCLTNLITADVAPQKFQTMDPVEQWWHETLHHGHLLSPHLTWCQRPLNQPWPVTVSTSALYISFQLWQRPKRFQKDTEVVSFFNKIRDMACGHPGLDATRKRRLNYALPDADDDPEVWTRVPDLAAQLKGRVQQYSFEFFPPLNELREAFEQYARLKNYEWDDAGDFLETPPATKRIEAAIDSPI